VLAILDQIEVNLERLRKLFLQKNRDQQKVQ
jgi:hypothetical protein